MSYPGDTFREIRGLMAALEQQIENIKSYQKSLHERLLKLEAELETKEEPNGQ